MVMYDYKLISLMNNIRRIGARFPRYPWEGFDPACVANARVKGRDRTGRSQLTSDFWPICVSRGPYQDLKMYERRLAPSRHDLLRAREVAQNADATVRSDNVFAHLWRSSEGNQAPSRQRLARSIGHGSGVCARASGRTVFRPPRTRRGRGGRCTEARRRSVTRSSSGSSNRPRRGTGSGIRARRMIHLGYRRG
jgi:hypothetical protein